MKLPKIFYGWYIVAASILIITLDGLLLYSFGVFLPFLNDEYGVSRIDASTIFAFRSIVLAFSLTIAGRMVDKYDPRAVVFIGGLIAALGLLCAGLSSTKWQFYASYGLLIGLGDGVLYITCVTLVSRWFIKKRALVIGIITTGMPLSGFLYPPITEWLITSFGVREAFFVLTAYMALILLFAFVLRAYPKDMGLKPYGDNSHDEPGGAQPAQRPSEEWGAMEAVKTSSFWLMYFTYALGFITFVIVVIHLFSYVLDSGLSTNIAAFTVACIGIGSIFGRIVLTGFLTAILKSEKVLFLCFLCQGSSVFLVLFFTEAWSFYLFGILFGFSYSGFVPIFPQLLGDFFGLKALGAIYGLMGTSYSVAAISGPMIAAYIYKTEGSYYYAFALTIAFCYVAAFSTFLIKRPHKKDKHVGALAE